jgi:pimeloyl-ACP methyl ester carboxylesterase
MNVNSRNLLRIAIVIVAAGYFAYASFAKKSDAGASAPVAAPIAPRATSFMLGTLKFDACELAQKKSAATTSAFCAPFSVPENRQAKEGRTIALKLALIKSDAVSANGDIVVFLAGGPGQSAVETWPQVAGAFAPLRRHHHILLLDQRGTGSSNPLTCGSSPMDEKFAAEADVDPAALAARTRECLASIGARADASQYTTSAAVEDLEAVRQALGAPQFDLVGISYGTRVAQQFLMRHADGVRSVVLDSVAPNELVFGAEFAINLENALKSQFALCTQTPTCAKAFGDPYASLTQLREQLRAQPRDYDVPDPVTFQVAHRKVTGRVVAGLVRMFAYTPESAALLPLSIAQGLKGNLGPLMGQAEVITGDLGDLADNGMQMSVICSEDADLLEARPQDAQLVLGTSMIDGLRNACAVWPHGSRPADFHAPLKSDKPILILEGEFDPVTPPRYGEQVLQGLSNGRLLVAKGHGHNVIGRGCMPKLVGDFVDKLTPKTLDAKCVDALGPIPAYIDFNGAAP